MLISDFRIIGNRLYFYRKQSRMRQVDIAAAADISERSYANIERGLVNPRLTTLLKICNALGITPDAILTEENASTQVGEEDVLTRLQACSPKERNTALRLLEVYLDSLDSPSKNEQ